MYACSVYAPLLSHIFSIILRERAERERGEERLFLRSCPFHLPPAPPPKCLSEDCFDHILTYQCIPHMKTITAPFNNMWTLNFKAQPTNAFFATVDQIFGGSSQLRTTVEQGFVVWTVPNDLITARSGIVGRWRSRQTFD